MPKSSVIKRFQVENYFAPQALPKLRTYFGNVEKGQPNVYETPFAKGESTHDLLAGWDDVLVSISSKWPTLYEFEQEMAAKVGPLSVMLPLEERLDDVVSYYEGVHPPFNHVDTRALSAVLHEWAPVRGLVVRSKHATIEKMKKSTNSGSPYFTKRRMALNNYANRLTLNGDANGLTDGYRNCAVLGWRGQEGGYSKEDVKQRVVWMFPMSVNIAELQVYQPLIEAAQKSLIVPAWVSMEQVDKRITELFDTKDSNDLVICTDFTAFDQHFNSALSTAARDIIAAIFTQDDALNNWINAVFPVKYHIPMALNMTTMASGEHGMGSGSGGTNADETLAHRALQYEAAIMSKQRLNPCSMCLGDDGIITYPGCTIDKVVAAYSQHGLEMNTSKQYASTQDCVYLRRWHHAAYRVGGICAGVYSTNRALGRLRYLERFMDPEWWGPKAVALRQLSILENVKYHPLRDQFADYCMKRDKYRLGIDIPNFLNTLPQQVKEVNEHMPDFLGYTKTLQSEGDPTYGINSWWIVNYLKSKA